MLAIATNLVGGIELYGTEVAPLARKLLGEPPV